MSRVNLLPDEVRQQRRNRGRVRQIRFFGICGLLLLGGLYAVRTGQILLLQAQLNDLRDEQAAVQAKVDALAEVRTTRDAVVVGEGLTLQLLSGEVSWSEQLLEIATAVPDGFGLTSLSGQAVADSGTGIVGSVSFTATAPQILPAETWLVRIAAQEGWANGWVSSVIGDAGAFAVNGSFDLTADAITPRGGGPA